MSLGAPAKQLAWAFESRYFRGMQRASVASAKNQLKALIDRVRRGETVIIEDHGLPVAQLQPVWMGDGADRARITRLLHAGVLRPTAEPPSKKSLPGPLPRLKRSASGVAALNRERREGR